MVVVAGRGTSNFPTRNIPGARNIPVYYVSVKCLEPGPENGEIRDRLRPPK
jgi:hypothetical protein